ncbi:hypothetical protein BHE74_00033062 [Ensete ventricosum]|nr:hypothetical protein GW17_00028593 [Ensete ventricosum]RWW59974.1 hypothetical protein BHE74_00033062 [Ensete ventricosum]
MERDVKLGEADHDGIGEGRPSAADVRQELADRHDLADRLASAAPVDRKGARPEGDDLVGEDDEGVEEDNRADVGAGLHHRKRQESPAVGGTWHLDGDREKAANPKWGQESVNCTRRPTPGSPFIEATGYERHASVQQVALLLIRKGTRPSASRMAGAIGSRRDAWRKITAEPRPFAASEGRCRAADITEATPVSATQQTNENTNRSPTRKLKDDAPELAGTSDCGETNQNTNRSPTRKLKDDDPVLAGTSDCGDRD